MSCHRDRLTILQNLRAVNIDVRSITRLRGFELQEERFHFRSPGLDLGQLVNRLRVSFAKSGIEVGEEGRN